MHNKLYFSRVKKYSIIPSKKEEDAGYDVYACFDEDYIVIEPHAVEMIPTGIASSFSPKYVAILKERGSTGTKNMGQRCGVIDSGYRGEWFIPISNHSDKPLVIWKEGALPEKYQSGATLYPYEKAICQAIMVEVPNLDVMVVPYEVLKDFKSERGAGMLGSSNK